MRDEGTPYCGSAVWCSLVPRPSSPLFPLPSSLFPLFDWSPLLRLRNAVSHPLRRRRALQVVIEELLHPLLEVLLILLPREMVRLARIREQDHLLPPATRGAVQLQALMPVHRVVRRAVQNQEGRRDVAGVIER